MRAAWIAGLAWLGAACGDSTDIAGNYSGNATYTLTEAAAPSGATGAQFEAAAITTDGGTQVLLAAACALSASITTQVDVRNDKGDDVWVTTADIASGQPCTIALAGQGDVAFSTLEGGFEIGAGEMMTLDVGGPTDSGYVVVHFTGTPD